MTTGGGASDVGAMTTGEELDRDAMDCWPGAEVGAAASSEPCVGDGTGCGVIAEDGTRADVEGYTVVYSVLMTYAVERTSSGDWVELEIGNAELLARIGDASAVDWDTAALLEEMKLEVTLVGWVPGNGTPGWLKPGRPVELPVDALLVVRGVGEAIGVP